MKKLIISLILCLAIISSFSIPAFAADVDNNYNYMDSSPAVQDDSSSNPFNSPDNYIKYLESFGDEYSVFLAQFKALPFEKQQAMLNVLSNGGTFDVKFSKPTTNNSSATTRALQRSVYTDADYQLFGITFVTVRLEGRFTYSGATVKTVEYKNAYIVKNWVPLTGFERTSLDAYVSGGRFYASAAFTAYVGAKIGDNIIGVTPRTFYISMNCDGYGDGTASAS